MLDKLLGRYAELKSGDKKGFTLIELVVVIVIIAILALIAVPNIMGYVAKSEKAKAEANLRSVYTAVQLVNQTDGKVEGEGTGMTNADKVKEMANINDKELAKYSVSKEGVITYKDGDLTVTFDGSSFGE